MKTIYRCVLILVLSVSCFVWSMDGVAAKYNQTVYNAHQRLKALGYNPGTVDGVMGGKTLTALKAFQKDQGLQVTGELDEITQQKLGLQQVSVTSSPAKLTGQAIANYEASIESAKREFQNGNYHQAMTYAEDALRINSEGEQALALMAILYEQNAQYLEAARYYKKLWETYDQTRYRKFYYDAVINYYLNQYSPCAQREDYSCCIEIGKKSLMSIRCFQEDTPGLERPIL